jgi:hypothetical protein
MFGREKMGDTRKQARQLSRSEGTFYATFSDAQGDRAKRRMDISVQAVRNPDG